MWWLQMSWFQYAPGHKQPHAVSTVNKLRPRQNGCHFAEDTFKHILFNENVRISITISLKFVPKGPIDNMPALVQIMPWRQPWHRAITSTKFDLPLVRFSDLHLKAISQEIPQPSITTIVSKINYLSKISFKSPRGQWVKGVTYPNIMPLQHATAM